MSIAPSAEGQHENSLSYTDGDGATRERQLAPNPFTASLESVLVETIASSSDLEPVRMTCLMISCYYSQGIMIPRRADRPEVADPLAVTLSILRARASNLHKSTHKCQNVQRLAC